MTADAPYRLFEQPALQKADMSFLVTGGTGSFGQAFIRRLFRDPPKRVVVFSRDEQKQDAMAHELRELLGSQFGKLRFFIGDVRDQARLELAMREIDVVVHAAALKIVPTAEYNPFECILTNVHGAENVVKAALRTGVKKVLAMSTDKAANPINLYGASKLASDKIMVAANNLSGDLGTAFSVVRYGNVIGSRGSVLPFFQSLLKKGATSLPITDPRMTRFLISLEQGVNFVLSSIAMMRGGEIFVPKIPSSRITEFAETLSPATRLEVVGIRPGEKLHELMVTSDDARMTLEMDDRYVILPSNTDWSDDHLKALGARPVSADFQYSSDKNAEWLSGPALARLFEGRAA